jgi:hypothetical protein
MTEIMRVSARFVPAVSEMCESSEGTVKSTCNVSRSLARQWRARVGLGVAACNLLALVLIALSVATPTQRVAGATVPPVLVVTDSANSADPFGSYLGEILRAEGMTTFSTADVSALTSTFLASYTTVLLGPISSASPTLVTTLTSYVQGGGRLIAMHPPTNLAALFGVTSVGTTTSEGYTAIIGGGLGGSFNTTPLQFHGAADNYTLSGATAIAKLYSTATSATPYPSVTLATVGQGQAMLWAYDLARSVVYTRQGNPVNPHITNSDGGYRDTDLYSGYESHPDTQPRAHAASLVFPAECRNRACPHRRCARSTHITLFHTGVVEHSKVRWTHHLLSLPSVPAYGFGRRLMEAGGKRRWYPSVCQPCPTDERELQHHRRQWDQCLDHRL